jgi:hypothetical protein
MERLVYITVQCLDVSDRALLNHDHKQQGGNMALLIPLCQSPERVHVK